MKTYFDRLILNLEGLETAIRDAKDEARRHPATIYVETNDGPHSADGGVRFRLVEETLSDGSTVFNVILGA